MRERAKERERHLQPTYGRKHYTPLRITHAETHPHRKCNPTVRTHLHSIRHWIFTFTALLIRPFIFLPRVLKLIASPSAPHRSVLVIREGWAAYLVPNDERRICLLARWAVGELYLRYELHRYALGGDTLGRDFRRTDGWSHVYTSPCITEFH